MILPGLPSSFSTEREGDKKMRDLVVRCISMQFIEHKTCKKSLR